MATQGERRALFFLAALAVLGAGTRLWRSKRPLVNDSTLDAQIAAVDSAPSKRGRIRRSAGPPTRQPVDLDIASADEIERLPGIGPSLAKRIVADRAVNGPFGCLQALDRVKGVGPALLARLDSLATFSRGGAAPCGSPERAPAGLPPR
jgi:competence ComEA-like helix-hairpin-helix protein